MLRNLSALTIHAWATTDCMPAWNDWCSVQERGTRFGLVEGHRSAVWDQVSKILGRLHVLFDISGVRTSFKNLKVVSSFSSSDAHWVQCLPKLSDEGPRRWDDLLRHKRWHLLRTCFKTVELATVAKCVPPTNTMSNVSSDIWSWKQNGNPSDQ